MVGGAVIVTRKSRVILSSIWLLPFAVVSEVLISSKYVYLLCSCDVCNKPQSLQPLISESLLARWPMS
jgi:hypothetical protein